MKKKSMVVNIAVCLLAVLICFVISSQAGRRPPYKTVHDMDPNLLPPVITPEDDPAKKPSDAIFLFDGKDKELSEWVARRDEKPKWKVDTEKEYMEIVKKGGDIRTRKSFGSCQLHIEWASPTPAKGTSQDRGNSGIYFMGRYEVQVLDSYTADNYKDNRTYADGQAAALYGQYPPIVNACRKPGEWQTYDISFLAPKFDKDGNVTRKARVTVIHNGIVVQNNVEYWGPSGHKVENPQYRAHRDKEPIRLQDHGSPVRYRNIWIRELPEQ
jgi:hypothetical protein